MNKHTVSNADTGYNHAAVTDNTIITHANWRLQNRILFKQILTCCRAGVNNKMAEGPNAAPLAYAQFC